MLYTYDASGTKLKSEAPDNLNTFYAGAFEYRADNALLRIGLQEGQLVNEAGVYSVHYYLKDHLGNVRAVMEENGTIIQETEYYAFGLPIQRTGSDKNKYLYNGKEKQPQTEWLDYGARMYDPTIGRWMVVDRYSEKYLNLSGYNYVDNNPIRNIDSNGDTLVIQYFDSNGQTQRLHYGTNAKSFDNEGNVIGGYGFYNADGTLYKGDNAFVKAASDALARLNLGDAGKSLIDNLAGNKQTINIAQGKNSYDENIHSVGWNPNSTAMIPTEGASNGLSISRSFISLGHELSHAEDHLSSKFNPEKTWIGSGVNYPESEKYATHRENQLRSEQGLPLRTHYGVIESAPGIYGPDPLSKIIDSKGNSLFYKSVNYRKR